MGPILSLQTEAMRFVRSLLLGIPCGLLRELFRTLRAFLPHHPAALFLEDAAWVFGCCFMLQCYAWSFCAGILRWQYAAGLLIGLILWMLTAGAVWSRILLRFRRFGCFIRQKLTPVFVKHHENPQESEK